MQHENLHDALASHGIGLFVDTLDIPEIGMLRALVWARNHGNNVHVKPKARAQGGAHVLQGGGQAGANKLGEIIVLVHVQGIDDVVGDDVLAHVKGVTKSDVLDRVVDEVDSVMDGNRHDGGLVIGEDAGDTTVERL